MDVSGEVEKTRRRLRDTQRRIFSELTSWQRVLVARHPQRPYTLDYLPLIASEFIELHGDRLYREFFEQQIRTHRLGAPGNWHGGAAQKLSLTAPVQVDAFSSLLRGLTPEGETLVGRQPQRVVRAAAWRITLTDAGPASVVLWALSPSVYRLRIRRAHTRAVRAVYR